MLRRLSCSRWASRWSLQHNTMRISTVPLRCFGLFAFFRPATYDDDDPNHRRAHIPTREETGYTSGTIYDPTAKYRSALLTVGLLCISLIGSVVLWTFGSDSTFVATLLANLRPSDAPLPDSIRQMQTLIRHEKAVIIASPESTGAGVMRAICAVGLGIPYVEVSTVGLPVECLAALSHMTNGHRLPALFLDHRYVGDVARVHYRYLEGGLHVLLGMPPPRRIRAVEELIGQADLRLFATAGVEEPDFPSIASRWTLRDLVSQPMMSVGSSSIAESALRCEVPCRSTWRALFCKDNAQRVPSVSSEGDGMESAASNSACDATTTASSLPGTSTPPASTRSPQEHIPCAVSANAVPRAPLSDAALQFSSLRPRGQAAAHTRMLTANNIEYANWEGDLVTPDLTRRRQVA